MLFFAHIVWQSGRSSYYCARASDEAGALGAVSTLIESATARYGGGGSADVVSAQAWEWPGDPAPACPMRSPDGAAHAFKLRSRPFVESCLMALGVLASEAPAPPLPTAPFGNPSGGPQRANPHMTTAIERARIAREAPPAGAKQAPTRAWGQTELGDETDVYHLSGFLGT